MTPNLTIIIPTCTKLPQLKLEPYYCKNLNDGNKVTVVKCMRVNSNICDSQDTCNSYIRFCLWFTICEMQACQRDSNREVGHFFLLIDIYKWTFPSSSAVKTAEGNLYWWESRHSKLPWESSCIESAVHTIHVNGENIEQSAKSGTYLAVTEHSYHYHCLPLCYLTQHLT